MSRRDEEEHKKHFERTGPADNTHRSFIIPSGLHTPHFDNCATLELSSGSAFLNHLLAPTCTAIMETCPHDASIHKAVDV